MEHEGMVHALSEIRRVLIPNGILIDLRPVLDRWQIEVASMREIREMGRMQDFPVGLADDKAANQSVAHAAQNRWLTREQEEFFPFIYSWDSPNEMQEWIEDEWERSEERRVGKEWRFGWSRERRKGMEGSGIGGIGTDGGGA